MADAGPGFSVDLATAINNQDFRTTQQLTETAAGGQTGLGLGLLHEMVAVREGKVLAGRSAEGGALVLMALPGAAGESGAGDTGDHSTHSRTGFAVT